MKYIKEFDTIRALAVLLVIHHHWGPLVFRSAILTFIAQKVIPSGAFAVDLFFVLSGFLLTNILMLSKTATINPSGWLVIKNFVFRRSLRIFPVYYLFVGLLYLLNFQDIRLHFVYLYTYTTNFYIFHHLSWNDSLGHLWTLANEEQFYLIWPFCIVFIPNKYLLYLLVSFILVSTGITIYTESLYGFFGTILPYNCLSAFSIGGLYAYALVEKCHRRRTENIFLILLPFAVLLYILIGAGIPHIPFRLVNAVIAINMIIYIYNKRYGRAFGKFLNNKILINIGKMSYGIYLFHPVIPNLYYGALHFLERKIHLPKVFLNILYGPYLAEILELMLLMIIAYLSYSLIEIPLLSLKKHFTYKNDKAVDVMSSAAGNS